MARLIDADALIAKQGSIAKTFARSDAQKSLIGRVMYNTEKAPTIAAIPVEWLKQKTKHPDSYTQGSAKWILGCWKREQKKLGIEPKEGT